MGINDWSVFSVVRLTAAAIKRVAPMFDGIGDTSVLSCLQGLMGEVWADDEQAPSCARLFIGAFSFIGGDSGAQQAHELAAMPMRNKGINIFIPQNAGWQSVIEKVWGGKAAIKTRYATSKTQNNFDIEYLRGVSERLPDKIEIKPIGHALFERCVAAGWSKDLVGNFANADDFISHALGFVCLYDGEVVAGASSFSYYTGGIEIELDTREDFRRRGLAKAVAAKLILTCLERGLYPAWDAAHKTSLAIAESLGYVFESEYTAYEIMCK